VGAVKEDIVEILSGSMLTECSLIICPNNLILVYPAYILDAATL
jgi:hypothetical protein